RPPPPRGLREKLKKHNLGGGPSRRALAGSRRSCMIRATTLVGIISDTHGLLRHEALVAFRDCHLIVHAGDVGTADVLDGLRAIAPVIAIRGNNDQGAWASTLSETEVVETNGVSLYV